MFSKSSFIASVICIALLLTPPVVILLSVIRQSSHSRFSQESTTFPTLRRDSNSGPASGR
jgi:hypothetical protein